MKTIEYVGGQVAGRANPSAALQVTFSLTGGLASTPAAGDLVIVTCVTGSAGGNPAMAVTNPAGYSALGQLNQSATTNDTSMNVSYKFMGSTPDTTVDIPGTGNNAFAEAYAIQVFRNVDPSTPLDVAAVSAGGTGTGRPNPGSITPVTQGAQIVICGGGAAGTGANYTAPANYTTDFVTASGADTTDAMVGCGYRATAWTSGAEDPATYTGGTTNAADSWTAYTIALRPAPDDPLEDGDGWAGLQVQNAVAAAGGAAALALSVALAGSFSFSDDIVPQPAQPVVEDVWTAPQMAAPRPSTTLFWVDDELVPQPAVVEYGGVQLGERALHEPVFKSWEYVDELPQQPATLAGDEGEWSAPAPALRAPAWLGWWADDEIVTPATPLGVDEAYWLAPQPQVPQPVVRHFWFNDEITQVPTEISFDNTGYAQRRLHTPALKQWDLADELPQAAAPLGVDEAYWHHFAPRRVQPIVTVWQVEDEKLPAPDQQDAFSVAAIGAEPQPRVFSADDEWVPQAAPLGVDDAPWQVFTPPAARPVTNVFSSAEDIVPQPAVLGVEDERGWQLLTARVPLPIVTTWSLPDDWFVRAVPVESDWQVYTPKPLAPLVTLFQDEPVALDEWSSLVTPVYGWGARGRIGGSARDPWGRIGSESAADSSAGIGSASASDPSKRIGSDNA